MGTAPHPGPAVCPPPGRVLAAAVARPRTAAHRVQSVPSKESIP